MESTESRTDLELNPEQERAVRHGDGALLVVAGAGSGKTRVLTGRVAWLVEMRGLDPHEVLAFTFTNRAAREMRERIARRLGAPAAAAWIGTFHATCLRILRREAAALGLPSAFSIFDRDDQVRTLRAIGKTLGLEPRSLPIGVVLGRISGAKNGLVSPAEYEATAYTPNDRQVAQMYRAYHEELRRQAALDFDDLIALTVGLLENEPEARARWAGRFRHVLVDEYQDTNHSQFRLVAALASAHGNVTAVGDEDQSIYAWRGADLANVLEFERRFPGAEILRLERNYRSTSVILDAASAVIANNRRRRGKRLWTDRAGGQEIRLLQSGDEQAEAARIADEIRRRRDRGRRARDCAVLYRTNAQSRALELGFRQRGVPYELVGGVSFYERREVKDLLAYLRVTVNPRDAVSLLRIANVPRRGLGAKSLAALEGAAATEPEGAIAALARLLEAGTLSAPARRGAARLHALLARLAARRAGPPEELLETVLEEIDYLEYLDDAFPQDAAERRENVEELIAAARHFTATREESTAESFLGEAALVSDVDRWTESEDRAVLMTAHNAKGLEFPVVFVAGCEEGIFPHASALDDDDELEEERRLFYVALTRAQDEVIVSAAAFRRRFDGRGAGELSRFVREIPTERIRFDGPPGWPSPAASAPRPSPSDEEDAGRTVYHETFGKGVVLSGEGEGSRRKFTVRFARAGVKKVLGRFLVPDD